MRFLNEVDFILCVVSIPHMMNPTMRPKILVENETHLFKFLQSCDSDLDFDNFKDKFLALDKKLADDDNIRHKMATYYAWYKLEHIQHLFKTKKNLKEASDGCLKKKIGMKIATSSGVMLRIIGPLLRT